MSTSRTCTKRCRLRSFSTIAWDFVGSRGSTGEASVGSSGTRGAGTPSDIHMQLAAGGPCAMHVKTMKGGGRSAGAWKLWSPAPG